MEATRKKRNSQTEGTVLALMAALLWSTNAPLIKSLSLDATLVAGMRAAMITPLEMVFGPLWVAVFLHQYPDVIGLIGFLIIALGVVIEVVYTHRREKSALQQMQG